MEKFEKLYNVLDKSTMYLKDVLRNSYVDSLFINTRSLLEMKLTVDLPEITEKELLEMYKEVDGLSVTKEDIRVAVSYLTLRAFKEDNILNGETTSDVASLLVAHVINSIFKNKNNLAIIDPVCGTANLLTSVINNLNPEGLTSIGFEINSTSIKLAQVNADLQGNLIDFYIEDFIESNITGFDLAVFDSPLYIYDDEYFPHLLVDKLASTVKDNGYIVGLIPNDFFEVPSEIKSSILSKLSLVGLIVLNEELFKDKKLSKSIVIMKKTQDFNKEDVLVVTLPSIKDYDLYKNTLNNIKVYFNEY